MVLTMAAPSPANQSEIEMKRAGREIESEFGIEVANATPDEPEHGADNADPQQARKFCRWSECGDRGESPEE